MNLIEISIKNLLRRKGKAAFILLGLVIGVATVVTVITFADAMSADITHKLDKYGANILIVPRTDQLTLSYGGLSLGGVSFEMQAIEQSQLHQINQIENARNIAAVGPMVLGAVTIDDRRVLLAGVDFEAIPILKPWWQVTGRLPAADHLLLGSESARIFGLEPGKRVTMLGRELTVAGVLRPTGSQDDQLVFAPITTAQSLLGKSGQVSMVEVAALCEACPITEMVRQIGAALPGAKVMAIQQVVRGRMETLAQFRTFAYGISAVVLLIGSMVVMVTLMGSVRERTVEIGIFRAIGFRRTDVMRIVFIEAGIVAALAGILGYVAGQLTSRLGVHLVAPGRDVAVAVDWQLAAGAIVMAVVIGLVASAYPALMAARMDPNQALRRI